MGSHTKLHPKYCGKGVHCEDILCIAFMRPNILATASYDGEIVLWDTEWKRLLSRVNSKKQSQLQEHHMLEICSKMQGHRPGIRQGYWLREGCECGGKNCDYWQKQWAVSCNCFLHQQSSPHTLKEYTRSLDIRNIPLLKRCAIMRICNFFDQPLYCFLHSCFFCQRGSMASPLPPWWLVELVAWCSSGTSTAPVYLESSMLLTCSTSRRGSSWRKMNWDNYIPSLPASQTHPTITCSLAVH